MMKHSYNFKTYMVVFSVKKCNKMNAYNYQYKFIHQHTRSKTISKNYINSVQYNINKCS